MIKPPSWATDSLSAMLPYQKQAVRRGYPPQGFSLIELVIVVVIIAIIGAIAIPKMSRGAGGAGDSALIQELSVLRTALDAYQAENGGAYPAADKVANAMLQYNDGAGNLSPTPDAAHIYGPYLRSIPPLPVGARKSCTGIAAADAATIGWLYDASTGKITANTTTETDAAGALYLGY